MNLNNATHGIQVGLPKNISPEYNLPCVFMKDDTFFPKNMILLLGWKIKDDLSQKKSWKYDIFCKCSRKMAFPKKTHWNMVHLVLLGKMVFVLPENMILFFQCKIKDDLSQKKFMENFFKEVPPTTRATNMLNILDKVISLPSLLAEKTL